MSESGEWVVVHHAQTPWEAQVLRDWLVDAGIPCTVRSNEIAGYGGLTPIVSPSGWADLLVPPDTEEAARKSLEEFAKQPPIDAPYTEG